MAGKDAVMSSGEDVTVMAAARRASTAPERSQMVDCAS